MENYEVVYFLFHGKKVQKDFPFVQKYFVEDLKIKKDIFKKFLYLLMLEI